jgi:hypothetical protein
MCKVIVMLRFSNLKLRKIQINDVVASCSAAMTLLSVALEGHMQIHIKEDLLAFC